MSGALLPKKKRSRKHDPDRMIRIAWSWRARQFESRDERGALLGSNHDRVKTIWAAVLMADSIAETGQRCHVSVEQNDGSFKEEYVGNPPVTTRW